MIKYDKLKNIETDENFYNFICPECGANGINKGNFTVSPLGISYKPDYIDNSDLKNKTLRDGYNRLPTLREAIFLCVNKNSNSHNLSFFCNKCNSSISIYKKIDISLLRKYVNKNLNNYIDLRQNE